MSLSIIIFPGFNYSLGLLQYRDTPKSKYSTKLSRTDYNICWCY